jgi:exopolysaccharide production protein ExoQ
MIRNRSLLRGFAVVTFYLVLAADSVRYSLTWWGWGAIVIAITAISVVIVVKLRGQWRFNRLPYPLIAFVALTILSLAWSYYPLWTGVGIIVNAMAIVAGCALAISLTRAELLWALGTALRIILGLSLLFELVVAVIVRHPVLPWWENFGTAKIHAAYYWSRDVLFTGKQIQGIMGNSNLLGFVALLGLIVFAIQLASGSVRKVWGIFWLVIAAVCILLTRSATVTVALAVVAAVTIVLLLARYQRTGRNRIVVYVVSAAVGLMGIAVAVVFRDRVFSLLGKSDSLTGRTGIWSEVIKLASQRPVAGWGWVSYWNPFTKPFNSKDFTIGGVQYLQAHDAWLDIWFQLGIIGLIVFGALVLSTLVRTWLIAIDRTGVPRGERGPRTAMTLLPILLLVALLAQSLTESRLIIEYGMLLLTIIAVTSKRALTEPVPQ